MQQAGESVRGYISFVVGGIYPLLLSLRLYFCSMLISSEVTGRGVSRRAHHQPKV